MSWYNKGLTGKTRYRIGLFSKLVLQVEYKKKYVDNSYAASCGLTHPDDGKSYAGYWRDATFQDLQELELKQKKENNHD
jgi:hypothetical protein